MFFLFLFFLSIRSENKGFYKKVHSFKPPYLYGMTSNIPYWTYSGSSVATEKFVRLCPAVQSRLGKMWNDVPFKTTTNWEIILDFHVHNTKSPGADGFALWIIEKTEDEGPLFGMTENFKGVGILFDTYDNNHDGQNPAVIIVQNDGTPRDWDIQNDFLGDQLARCVSHFRNPINNVASAKIRIIAGNIKVKMDTVGKSQYIDCIPSTPFLDFDPNTKYHIAITAATGGLSDYHDVLRLDVKELVAVDNEDTRRGRKKGWFDPYKEKEEKIKIQKKKLEQDERLQQEGLNLGLRKETQQNSEIEFGIRKVRAKTEDERRMEADRTQQDRKEEKQSSKFFKDLQKRLEDKRASVDVNDDNLLVVLYTLDEVVNGLQSGMTKYDVTKLIRRIEAISDSQVSIGTQQVSVVGDVQNSMRDLNSELTKQTNILSEDLKRLNRILSSLGGNVHEMHAKTDLLNHDLNSKTDYLHSKYDEGKSSLVFYFVFLFEILFVIALFFYKKYTDEKRKKLL